MAVGLTESVLTGRVEALLTESPVRPESVCAARLVAAAGEAPFRPD